ncbi:alpha/beta fold hydrolase [Grimontia sp. NTOU-MAR1]|uniref:alpha/beta fold hydrolase n=1 Tax=Grimontia sp. NTOU-MAR1 TaxID=3111011 RepID=UPI002DBA9B60|nr:alpha/beta hydrolase [Grimontia sp. NTOU-MAR1]WRW00568.1 alpha/beta hydrolase [Grimontia sp. NTOU-MAR1]
MTTLRFLTIGTGAKHVVVLHEWLGDHSNYDPILPYINTKQFKWIFVDLRGYGLSKDLSGQYTCQEASEDVQRLVSELGIHSVYIVGHSMSAMVAQKIAVDNPELLKKMLLITPVPASGIQINLEDANILRASVFDDGKIRNAINLRTGERYNATWLDTKLKLANNASAPEARAGYMEMFLETDFSDKVKGLKIPVRVIVGKYDIPAFQKRTIQELFSDWYNDLEIIECSESGHYPMLECPIFFASTLEKLILDS